MKKFKRTIAAWLLLLAMLMSTGCGYVTYEIDAGNIIGGGDGPTSIIVEDTQESSQVSETSENSEETPQAESKESSEATTQAESKESSEATPQAESKENSEETTQTEFRESSLESELLDPDGSYTTCEDVALYIETYKELPDNFITKNEARKLGWEGGSLEPYAPGKCIGGDKFGNREGILPKEKGRTYRECDIDTLGAESRGAKRIVYSNDGLIYYTEDHYESFTLLYE